MAAAVKSSFFIALLAGISVASGFSRKIKALRPLFRLKAEAT